MAEGPVLPSAICAETGAGRRDWRPADAGEIGTSGLDFPVRRAFLTEISAIGPDSRVSTFGSTGDQDLW